MLIFQKRWMTEANAAYLYDVKQHKFPISPLLCKMITSKARRFLAAALEINQYWFIFSRWLRNSWAICVAEAPEGILLSLGSPSSSEDSRYLTSGRGASHGGCSPTLFHLHLKLFLTTRPLLQWKQDWVNQLRFREGSKNKLGGEGCFFFSAKQFHL